MIVLDASVVVDLLLRNDSAVLEARVLGGGQSLHAPHLVDVEVAHALRRFSQGNEISAARAGQAMFDLLELPLQRHGHEALLPRIWALRFNLTAYDAAYVALAEGLGAPLLTRDGRLVSAPGLGAAVELI